MRNRIPFSWACVAACAFLAALGFALRWLEHPGLVLSSAALQLALAVAYYTFYFLKYRTTTYLANDRERYYFGCYGIEVLASVSAIFLLSSAQLIWSLNEIAPKTFFGREGVGFYQVLIFLAQDVLDGLLLGALDSFSLKSRTLQLSHPGGALIAFAVKLLLDLVVVAAVVKAFIAYNDVRRIMQALAAGAEKPVPDSLPVDQIHALADRLASEKCPDKSAGPLALALSKSADERAVNAVFSALARVAEKSPFLQCCEAAASKDRRRFERTVGQLNQERRGWAESSFGPMRSNRTTRRRSGGRRSR